MSRLLEIETAPKQERSSYLKSMSVPTLNNEPAQESKSNTPNTTLGCGIMGRYPLTFLFAFALLGVALGIGLSKWNPATSEEANTKYTLIRWIGLIGDIFIRALKCIVLPLVFFNVVLSTVEMINMGKASTVGWKTIGVYLMTTLTAAIFGVVATFIFIRFYSSEELPTAGPPMVQLSCNDPGAFLAEGENGAVSCTANYTSVDDTKFIIHDVTKTFQTKTSTARADLSLSETIYTGVFHKLISSNIFDSFVGGDLLAVVFFAIIFGIALGRLQIKGKTTLLNLVKECDLIFIQMIVWVILITPFAVFSLIATRLGKDDDLAKSFSNIGYLFGATLTAMALQLVCMYFFVFWLFTRLNPFKYLSTMVPAWTMAFASSSSAATLPVTLSCVEATGEVPNAIASFVLPLGATINMDGTAIYIPAACIWLAVLNGHTPNAAQYIVLIILGTVGSAGAAPIPSASLVLIITAYNTVFNQSGVPAGFSFILAIDWLVDSFRTMLNVTGDSIVAAIVAKTSHLENIHHDMNHHTDKEFDTEEEMVKIENIEIKMPDAEG